MTQIDGDFIINPIIINYLTICGVSAISTYDPFAKPLLPVQLFFTLYKTNTALVRRLEQKLEPMGLTLGRLCLLYAMQRIGRPALPSELGDDLAVTRANISGLLKQLEKAGLVRREFDPANRRQIFVHFTDKGREVLDQAWPVYESAIQASFSGLTAKDQEQLLLLLQKLN